jgi:type VI secretion system protein ImpG
LAKQAIEGVLRISSERTTAWVGTAEFAGFVRGLNVQLELDETRFVGSSGFLFASVIERFLGLYVSVNSFTQLTARFRQHEADLKRWPPRSGAQPLG